MIKRQIKRFCRLTQGIFHTFFEIVQSEWNRIFQVALQKAFDVIFIKFYYFINIDELNLSSMKSSLISDSISKT